MKTSVFLLSLLLFGYVHAITKSVPSTKYKEQDKDDYGWMKSYPTHMICTEINKTASKFITEEEFKRYSKLKVRGFIKDLKFIEENEGNERYDYNYFKIHLELYKYNDTLDIYYGLFELEIYPSVLSSTRVSYRITTAIAGANTQIKRFIKEEIDDIIEEFAEDYYYIQDLK